MNKKKNLIGMGLLFATAAAPVIAGVYAENVATEAERDFKPTSKLVPNTAALKGGNYNVGDILPQSVYDENSELIKNTNQVYKYIGASDFSLESYGQNDAGELEYIEYSGLSDLDITFKKNGADFYGYTLDKKERRVTFHQPLKKTDKIDFIIKKPDYVTLFVHFGWSSEANNWAASRDAKPSLMIYKPTDKDNVLFKPGA